MKFLYSDELLREDEINPLHLFATAGRLQITELKDFAVENIMNQIDSFNIHEVFQLANKYGHDELVQKSFEEIKKKHPKIEFHEELATDPEKVAKVIEALRRKEEAIRKIENEFENLVMESKKL